MASRLQNTLLKECKKRRILAWSNNATGYGRIGIPDILMITDKGTPIFAEIKEKGDRLSEIQKDTISELRARRVIVFIVKSNEDIDLIMEIIDVEGE